MAVTYRMGIHWPPYPCLSAQGTPSTTSMRLRDEAKAYLQALEVGLREAPTAPKVKCARSLLGSWGTLGCSHHHVMARGPVLQKAAPWWPGRARAKPQGRHC